MKKKKLTGILCLMFILSFLTYSIVVVGFTGASTMGENTLPAELIPGGNVIGVKLYTNGVHVVGITSVETKEGKIYPGRQAGLKEGDFILKMNGEGVESNEMFAQKLQQGGEIPIEVSRDGNVFETKLTPVTAQEDGLLRAGLWVRDSTAGIGTITFYDPNSKMFGALGHAITDSDTGKILSVKKGAIYNAFLTSVKKGEKGKPGELNGLFANQDRQIGSLAFNTDKGIFGQYDGTAGVTDLKQPLPVGNSDFVKEGKATIYASIDKDEVREYEIEIVKVIKGNAFTSKGMVIQITDPELLNKTGGIVQGMSGSPIIQDGHIVGAVTHVFINEPTKGYGIFIGNMLSQIKASESN